MQENVWFFRPMVLFLQQLRKSVFQMIWTHLELPTWEFGLSHEPREQQTESQFNEFRQIIAKTEKFRVVCSHLSRITLVLGRCTRRANNSLCMAKNSCKGFNWICVCLEYQLCTQTIERQWLFTIRLAAIYQSKLTFDFVTKALRWSENVTGRTRTNLCPLSIKTVFVFTI